MKRCHNNTIGVDEIVEVLDHAEQLHRRLAAIEFVLTEEEQRGLYSIIRNLEFETWDRDDHHGNFPTDIDHQVESQPLRDLLQALK